MERLRKRSALTDDHMRDALDAYDQADEIATDAAAALGLNRNTFTYRLRKAKAALASGKLARGQEAAAQLPTFPSGDLPTEQIIESLSARFEQRMAHDEAKRYFDITFPDDSPRLLACWGDPHLGVHTNWKLLTHHVKLVSENAKHGVHCIAIGDQANNWGGRLTALYAEEDISRETERRLAKWFLEACPWILWLHGNHEHMNQEFSTYLEAINAQKVPMIDWRARVRFVFPSTTVKADFSHNFKGSSIYSRLHGLKRSVLWEAVPDADGQPCDLVVAGHHHVWAIAQDELDDGRCVILARCRGYKFSDTYAHRHNFASLKYGATLAFVIVPLAEGPMKITPFPDLEQGIDYLKFMRSKYRIT